MKREYSTKIKWNYPPHEQHAAGIIGEKATPDQIRTWESLGIICNDGCKKDKHTFPCKQNSR